MQKLFIAIAVAASCSFGPAWAGPCSEQIKALQAQAKQTDAKNSPGSQSMPTEATSSGEKISDTAPKGGEGGGAKSASAKILEAQAHDQRRDEAKCMEAVNEARTLIDQ